MNDKTLGYCWIYSSFYFIPWLFELSYRIYHLDTMYCNMHSFQIDHHKLHHSIAAAISHLLTLLAFLIVKNEKYLKLIANLNWFISWAYVKIMCKISPKTPLCSSNGCSAVSQIVFNKHSSPLKPALKIEKNEKPNFINQIYTLM